jgi:hypothetical protein
MSASDHSVEKQEMSIPINHIRAMKSSTDPIERQLYPLQTAVSPQQIEK